MALHFNMLLKAEIQYFEGFLYNQFLAIDRDLQLIVFCFLKIK